MDNEMLIQQPEAPKKNFLKLFIVVMAIVAVVELYLLLQQNGKFPTAVTTSTVDKQVTEAPVEEGVLSLSVGKQVTTVGTPINFVVKLDSSKRGVVGMDAIVSFDKKVFSASPAQSTLKGFTAVSSSRKNYLEVTLSKDPQTVEIPVLENEDIFSFTLVPNKAGVFKVELLSEADRSSSKFVDSDTEIFLPKVNSVTVTVK